MPVLEHFKRLGDRMKKNVIEFCQTTNLHGFQYMMNEKASTFRRLFFTIATSCSIALCLYLIVLQIYDTNGQSIISSVTSTAYPIWKIRFPAVTICNVNAVHKDNIHDFKKIMEPFQINEDLLDAFLSNLRSLINFDEVRNSNRYDEIFQAFNRSGYHIDDIMQMLTSPCDVMIEQCTWQTHNVSCTEIFEQIKTTHGYCCSFNYYGTQKHVDHLNNTKNLRYLYAKGAGSTFSLRIKLNTDVNQYISKIENAIGFNVQVQDIFNYPDLDYISNTVEQDTLMTISIKPNVYASSDLLRSLPIKSRNCMFHDEGNLRWSSIYTFSNCVNECLSNTIFKYCNCVPFYYPKNSFQKMCTFNDIECLQINKFNYSALINPDDPSTLPDNIDEADSKIMECNCYPLCNENMLDFHIDQTKTTDIMKTNISMLTVFFNEMGCTKTEREIYYTWDQVLASIGGIFGLCLGGSVISVLEAIFFIVNSFIYCEKRTKTRQTGKTNKFSDLVYVQDFNHHRLNKSDKNNFKKQSINNQVQFIFTE